MEFLAPYKTLTEQIRVLIMPDISAFICLIKQSRLLLVWVISKNVKNKIKHIIKLTKDKDPNVSS